MDERMRFVARLVEGEKMAVLCREFDISRKTGYKIFNRYKHSGLEGLTDRSRRPYRHANRLPFQIEQLILQLKERYSSWGAQKIRDKILLERVGHAAVMLRGILGEDAHPDIPWSVAYLRARLAEHPAEGYKTWAERVAELERGRQAGGQGGAR